MGKKRADGEGTYFHYVVYDKKTGGKTKDLWRYTIIVNDKKKTFSASPKNGGKTAAKAKYDAWRNKHDKKPVLVAKDVTVHEWALMYLEANKKNNVTDSWYDELKTFINALPSPFLHKKVEAVLPIEIQNVLNSSCKKKSKSYSDKMATLLRSLFREAFNNGLCKEDPAKNLKNLNKIEAPRHSYTFDEALRVMEYAATYRDNYKNSRHKECGKIIGVAIITLLTTGLRRGELLGLKWSDLSGNKLTVNRAVYMKSGEDGKRHPVIEEYHAKNRSSLRIIPLPDITVNAIASLKKRGLYIFCNLNGDLIIPRNFNKSYSIFVRDLQKANPDLPKRHPHECRHTFATLTLDKGANIKVLQLLLGHKKMETTARYLHPDFKELENAQKSTWETHVKEK